METQVCVYLSAFDAMLYPFSSREKNKKHSFLRRFFFFFTKCFCDVKIKLKIWISEHRQSNKDRVSGMNYSRLTIPINYYTLFLGTGVTNSPWF